MKKFIKAIILLPLWPFIWVSGASADEEYEGNGSCHDNGVGLLQWFNK